MEGKKCFLEPTGNYTKPGRKTWRKKKQRPGKPDHQPVLNKSNQAFIVFLIPPPSMTNHLPATGKPMLPPTGHKSIFRWMRRKGYRAPALSGPAGNWKMFTAGMICLYTVLADKNKNRRCAGQKNKPHKYRRQQGGGNATSATLLPGKIISPLDGKKVK